MAIEEKSKLDKKLKREIPFAAADLPEKIPEAEPEREKEPSAEDKELWLKRLKAEEIKLRASPTLEEEAKEQAQKIKSLALDEKLKKLLGLVSEKGIVFSVRVAKEINDPYLMDAFHDILIRDGYYKKN